MDIDLRPHLHRDDVAPLTADLVRFIEADVSLERDVQLEVDTDLVMSGLVDSLGVVMIVEWLERRLDVTIDPGDVVIEHFASVGSIVEYLHARDDRPLDPGS